MRDADKSDSFVRFVLCLERFVMTDNLAEDTACPTVFFGICRFS